MDKLIQKILNKGGDVNALAFIQSVIDQPLLVEPTSMSTIIYQALGRKTEVDTLINSGMKVYGDSDNNTGYDIRWLNKDKGVVYFEINGGIMDRHQIDWCGGAIASYEGILHTLNMLVDDPMVSKVICRINSSGGVTTGAFHCNREIQKLRGRGTELIALSDSRMLSGAYVVGSAFDRVVVSHGAVVGSIGVYLRLQNHKAYMDAIGVKTDYIYRGDYKLTGAPDIDMDAKQREFLDETVGDYYSEFITCVSESRGMSEKDVVNTQARWYSDKKAIESGLADDIMSFAELSDSLISTQSTSQGTNMNGFIEALVNASNISAQAKTALISALQDETDVAKVQSAIDAQKEAESKVAQASREATIREVCKGAGVSDEKTTEYISGKMTVSEITADIVSQNVTANEIETEVNTSASSTNTEANVDCADIWKDAYA